jgi:hypothetical protein
MNIQKPVEKNGTMKKLPLLRAVAATCFAAAFQVSAQVPTPLTPSQSPPDFQDTATSSELLSNGKGISGAFNLETDTGSITIGSAWTGHGAGNVYNDYTGFNPLTETAVSGTLNLWIEDSDGHSDSYSVDLGSSLFTSGDFPGPSGMKVTYNFTDGDLNGDLLTIINTKGELSYTITDTGTGDDSDFTVDYMVLQVDTTVPDSSSTALLLGGVLSAICFIKRKMV